VCVFALVSGWVIPIDCSPKLLSLSKSHRKLHHLCELLRFIWIINVASFKITLMSLCFAQAISKEAAEFGLGETKYYTILLIAAIVLQLLVIGSLGVIFNSSSLLGGLVSSLLVPVQQAFAVMILKEVFNAEKGMALAMCLWGFASYLYGEYQKPEANKEESTH